MTAGSLVVSSFFCLRAEFGDGAGVMDGRVTAGFAGNER